MPLVPLWGSGWSFWIRDYLKLCQSTIDGGQNELFIDYEQRGFDCSDTGIRDTPKGYLRRWLGGAERFAGSNSVRFG